MAIHLSALRDTDLDKFCSLSAPDKLTPELVLLHRPDALLTVVAGKQITARASLWWSQVPKHPSQRIGLIGHFSLCDTNAAEPALTAACGALAENGCTLAVAPMDGSTWRRYRLLTERGPRPLFFLEPDNPDDWPRCFLQQGFFPLARYVSAENEDIGRCLSPDAQAERLAAAGFFLRPFNTNDVDQELDGLWQVASAAFEQNFLYTPIDRLEFCASYRHLLPVIRPDLVFVAEKNGAPVGFCFAVPDLRQAQRNLPVDTVVLKTVAVLPEYRSLGLGTLLVARSTLAARQLGMRRAIHALMHEHNPSRKLARVFMKEFRAYTLFARQL
jgi:GNAT superfamily N-acetyltransferase